MVVRLSVVPSNKSSRRYTVEKLKMELIIGDGGAEMHNASLPVRWCINQGIINTLKKLNVQDPHVLLVVVGHGHYGRNETRYLTPLGDMMTYVLFRCPGVNKVYGTIVADPKGGKRLRDIFLTKTDGDFNTDVISADDKINHSFEGHNSCTYDAISEVVIPEELFGNPPKWERKWVNLWFRSRPIDECDYRRRRIIAYTIQPIVMAFAAIALGIFAIGIIVFLSTVKIFYALFLLSLGFKKVNLRPLLEPFEDKISAIGVDNAPTWTLPRWKGRRLFFLVPFTPFYVFLAFCGIFLFSSDTRTLQEIAMNTGIYAVLLPFLTLLCFYLIGHILSEPRKGVKRFAGNLLSSIKWKIAVRMAILDAKTRKEDREQTLRILEKSRQYEAMQTLLCKDGPVSDLRADIDALPEEKRSMRLYFYAIKAKVCRPFAA